MKNMRFVFKSIKALSNNNLRQLSFVSVIENPLQIVCKHAFKSNRSTKCLLSRGLQNDFGYRLNATGNQVRHSSSVISSSNLQNMLPAEFQEKLKAEKISRCFITSEEGNIKYSHDVLKDLIPESELRALEFEHEAIFFYTGTRSDCLMSIFLWRTDRGQGVSAAIYL